MRSLRSIGFVAVPLIGAGVVLALAPSCFSPEYASPGFYCHADDSPACPDGQTCVAGRCIMPSDSVSILKTGIYTGPSLDPGLTDVSKCTDSPLEPNDTIATAVPSLNHQLNLVVDGNTSKIPMLAICPTGNNPLAKGHDFDFYSFDAPQSLNALVEISYDVRYGDLDVAIFRADGSIVASDGSAVSNGCVATPLPVGKYFVGVGGANNKDSNRYDLRIRFFSTPRACTGGAGDMGTPVDLSF